jgi:hypothetical protein
MISFPFAWSVRHCKYSKPPLTKSFAPLLDSLRLLPNFVCVVVQDFLHLDPFFPSVLVINNRRAATDALTTRVLPTRSTAPVSRVGLIDRLGITDMVLDRLCDPVAVMAAIATVAARLDTPGTGVQDVLLIVLLAQVVLAVFSPSLLRGKVVHGVHGRIAVRHLVVFQFEAGAHGAAGWRTTRQGPAVGVAVAVFAMGGGRGGQA